MPQRRNSDATGLDSLVPGEVQAKGAVHFRNIITARRKAAEAEQELRDAVQSAHDAGDSWTVIGAALDTTRQAAFERFVKAANDTDSQGSPPQR